MKEYTEYTISYTCGNGHMGTEYHDTTGKYDTIFMFGKPFTEVPKIGDKLKIWNDNGIIKEVWRKNECIYKK